MKIIVVWWLERSRKLIRKKSKPSIGKLENLQLYILRGCRYVKKVAFSLQKDKDGTNIYKQISLNVYEYF